jgi:hypothetical protein
MPTKSTTARSSAPSRAANTSTAAAPSAALAYESTVKDVVIDVLLKRAFPHGQWAHVTDWLEQQNLAPEVRDEIAAAVERSR